MKSDCRSLLSPVVDIAVQAGRCVMDVYERSYQVAEKEDRSPLTEADLASHRCIVARLTDLTPDIPILSEESATQFSWAEREQWQRYWLVDPLDGTKEFIKRNGEFTVNIALVEDHRPVLGVVHVPAQSITYTGVIGEGATRIQPSGESEPIAVTPTAPSVLRVVGSRSHGSQHVETYLEYLGPHEFLARGSSLKLCLVAEGEADLYPRLGLTSEWDTAAAQCVVEAAGGHVVTLDNEPLSCNRKDSLLNPYFLVYADSRRDWFSGLPEALRAA